MNGKRHRFGGWAGNPQRNSTLLCEFQCVRYKVLEYLADALLIRFNFRRTAGLHDGTEAQPLLPSDGLKGVDQVIYNRRNEERCEPQFDLARFNLRKVQN